MSAYQYIKGAISCSLGTAYTGSFVKLQVLNNSAADGEVVELERIEFGQLAVPESLTTITSVTGPVKLHIGQSIDGPIARFKVGDNEDGKGVLAYFQ
tara:strand:+ start:280 stop:570 length:291 start_codon:yes stop_codon:yes gene_type:complete